jgi:ethanolamine utilization protein EutQ (cupin superfamily)
VAHYDPAAPNARRYPRVIVPDEIDKMPRLQFNTGIETNIFLSRERDDARYFRHGYCYGEPDHLPYRWDQKDFDETHFVLKGKIHLVVEDAAGRSIVLEAVEGEHIYLPAGYEYTLEATGVAYTFFWTSGPSPKVGVADAAGYSRELRALRISETGGL